MTLVTLRADELLVSFYPEHAGGVKVTGSPGSLPCRGFPSQTGAFAVTAMLQMPTVRSCGKSRGHAEQRREIFPATLLRMPGDDRLKGGGGQNTKNFSFLVLQKSHSSFIEGAS